MQLRPYQTDAIDDLTTEAAGGKKRLLLVCPTGGGKTLIAGKIIQTAVSNGYSVLFLAHRRELIFQCAEKLKLYGINCGLILAQEPLEPYKKVQVASIQSYLVKVFRKRHFDKPVADLVVFDEAHHLLSSSTWMRILEEYKDSIVLGMTATPINRKGQGMGHCFDTIVSCPPIKQLTRDGYLVPVRYFAPSIPDLNGVKVQAGDYVESQLESRMDTPKLIGDICENWARICPDRKTIIFASGVKHSIHIAETFNQGGVKAEHIDGSTDKEQRDNIIERFKSGEVRVLVNCQVLTEGFDCPDASCLVFARPTKSLMLYIQVAGRVLRSAPGKADCIIIDHSGVVYEHGPVDQDFEWKMEYEKGSIEDDRVKIKVERKKRQITCDQCKMIYEGRLECPGCGWKPTVRGKPVNTYEAYLQEIDGSTLPQVDKKMWWKAFRGHSQKMGYKPGWAWVKFKEKFGHSPKREWDYEAGIVPPLEVVSWIKYTQIKWAKRRDKDKAVPAQAPFSSPKQEDLFDKPFLGE